MNYRHPSTRHAAHKSRPASLVLAVAMLLGIVPANQGENTTAAEVHAKRGMSFAHSQDWAGAERELKQAVSAAPGVAIYHAQLASILGLEGKWNECQRNFERAVELDPKNISFRRETAAVQWQTGSIDAAERNLRFVLERVPADPGATLLLGLVAEARGNYKNAATLLSSQM
ncbi:MAG TPA: tetratricopeptide repeat protein, partial [Chthoniobacterales bacterium]|nr:tetratricopeptide repeat protein [Chthoniobacterales bacterium]